MSESDEIKNASSQSYWANVKKQFKKNKTAVYSLKFILALVVIAVFADLIANEKPLIAKYKGEIYFPVFKSYSVDIRVPDTNRCCTIGTMTGSKRTHHDRGTLLLCMVGRVLYE